MKVLLLVPNLTITSGGVGNIYKVLRLPEYGNIENFYVNTPAASSKVSSLISLLWKYLSFFVRLLTTKYDLVHINPSLNAKSFFRDGVFIRIAKITGTPVLTFFHGWEDSFEQKIHQSGFYKKWFLNTFARSTKFIVLGQVFKDKLIKMGVDNSKEFFLETTVADDTFLPELNLAEKLDNFNEEVKILFISRLVKEKGMYIAMEAFDKVQKASEHKLKLIIAGDGPELLDSKTFVEENKIANVEFPGYVSGKQKGEVLVDSHILLFPTYYGEGLPCTILEGMLYAMPIISRVNAGIPDVIQNQTNGYITDSLDPELFADYLNEIISDESLYRSMAKTNHKTAKERFVSDKVRDRMLNIYQTFKH